jgi:hypothetical protein
MARGQVETDRLQVMLALTTLAFLDLLARKGTHGVNSPDVAKSLIEKGINAAIHNGDLTPDEVKMVRDAK